MRINRQASLVWTAAKAEYKLLYLVPPHGAAVRQVPECGGHHSGLVGAPGIQEGAHHFLGQLHQGGALLVRVARFTHRVTQQRLQYRAVFKLIHIRFLKNIGIVIRHTPANRQYLKNRNKYSQKRNRAATVPVSKFMCLWVIFILYFHDRSAYYAAGKYVDRSCEYTNRSQTN